MRLLAKPIAAQEDDRASERRAGEQVFPWSAPPRLVYRCSRKDGHDRGGDQTLTSKPASSAARRLGPYEFIGPLGAGGMGEVSAYTYRRFLNDLSRVDGLK